MAVPEAAAAHYQEQQRLTLATLVAVRTTWKLMTPDLDVSWSRIVARLVTILTAAQLGSARQGLGYVPEVLDELGTPAPSVAVFDPVSLTGIASDGRPLDSLLYGAVARTRAVFIDAPAVDPREALAAGGRWLDMATQTQVADTARVAVATETATRPKVQGYVRMLNPPSCSRCVVLAGRWYRWNRGFERHPRCDCRHIPAAEDSAGDLTTSPDRYFRSLSPAEQDRIFTPDGAEAIRAGADLGQVVNARRGMEVTQVYGRKLAITREGTSRRGAAFQALSARGTRLSPEEIVSRGRNVRQVQRVRAAAPRLMPEAIFQVARSRDDAIRLLKANGYIT